MQKLIALWNSVDARRRAMAVGVLVAVLAGFAVLFAVTTDKTMALLYAGLDGPHSAEVLTALDQRGASYEVRGDAIYVAAAERDALRMSLAGEGLPASTEAGYELLDSLSGFGTTSQMFDAAYWRAKEGELARTIVTGLNIRSARVHIANPATQGLRARTKPTASVTVSTRSDALGAAQAKALRYLVASAVAGMAPEDVSVIDAERGLVLSGPENLMAERTGDRAEALRRNVARLLEARVGAGNAIVEVSVDAVDESETITEHRFDPQGRVAISTDTEEKSTSAKDGGKTAVTVASNLPSGDKSQGTGSQSQNSETRERVNFEVSETTREVLRTPGATRRVSVAVMVNDLVAVAADGSTTTTPRTPEELATLRDLVASAVGFDEKRGDVITLKSLEFQPISTADGTIATSSLLHGGLEIMTLVQTAVLAIVVLVLGLFVLRPLLLARPLPVPALPKPQARAAADASPPARPVLSGEIDDRAYFPDNMAVVAQPLARPDAGRAALGAGAVADPVTRLRGMIDQRQDETMEVLRSWMDTPQTEKI